MKETTSLVFVLFAVLHVCGCGGIQKAGVPPLIQKIEVASTTGDASALRKLLTEARSEPQADRDVMTDLALQLAIFNGHTHITELLLSEGVAVTPSRLLGCIRLGRTKMLELLLNKRVDVNHVFEDGSTFVLEALGALRPGVLELLLAHGADPNVAIPVGQAPIVMKEEWKHGSFTALDCAHFVERLFPDIGFGDLLRKYGAESYLEQTNDDGNGAQQRPPRYR